MDGIEIPVSMHPLVRKILPQQRHENPNLVDIPSQASREQRQAHRLTAPVEILIREPADFLVLLLLGPGVDRPFELADRDVDVTSLLHHFREIENEAAEFDPQICSGFLEIKMPLHDGRVVRHRIVVTANHEVDIVNLEITIGLERANMGFMN